MARTKAHTIDGEIEEFRLIFTPSGVQLVEVYHQWETDDAGRLLERQPPGNERIEHTDLNPSEKSALTILANLRMRRKQARWG